jgi:DNA-binding MarR family transcriptional regulator
VARLGQELAGAGLVELRRPDSEAGAGEAAFHLTVPGRAALDRLSAARRRGLEELLGGWSPKEHEEVVQMVARLASDLMSNALADPAMVEP